MQRIPPIVKTYKFPETWIMESRTEITVLIPNVQFAKKHNLLKTQHGIPLEMIKYNMELCGFDVVSYGTPKGNQTKIVTNCCNPDCDGTIEKQYNSYINSESAPMCKSCYTIVRSLNVSKGRPVLATIEFESVAEASRQLNIPHETIHNHAKIKTPHKSGWRFEFLD